MSLFWSGVADRLLTPPSLIVPSVCLTDFDLAMQSCTGTLSHPNISLRLGSDELAVNTLLGYSLGEVCSR